MRSPITMDRFTTTQYDLRAPSPAEQDQSAIEPLPATESEPGAFARFAGMIGRRHRAILIVTLLCVSAATQLLRVVTPLYTVSAKIMIQRVSTDNGKQSSDDRQRALRNEQELVVSTPVLASALAVPGVHDISPLRGRFDALKLIKQQIRVDTGLGDDLLNISYDAADPREGTRLLSAVVDAYVRFRAGLHGTSTDGSAATLLGERQKALENLKQLRAQLQRFGAEHGLAEGNEQVDAAGEALHELGVSLAQARVQAVAAKAAYDDMQQDLASDPRMRDRLLQSKDNDSSLAGGDEQAIAKQICSMEAQLAGYGTKFMANYEPVQLLHRRIEDLKFTRDGIIQQQWQAAVRAQSELQASYVQEETAATQCEVNKQLFDQHKDDVADAQKQVATIEKQLREIDSANKLITTLVTVIEPATPSDRPTSPRSGLILLIAAIAGLSLGLGIAAVRDRGAQVASPGSLKMLGDGLPMLARLPAVSRMQLSMNSWRDRMVDSAAEFAGACRKVHGALEAVASFSGGRTVLVTSTSAHEGKSTLASLLALTLAQTGKRVLLVDANLHAPSQGGIFGIDGDYGLGQLLEEEIESSFVSYVHPGSDDRLDILLSGSSSIAIAELLNSQRFTNLMAAMAAEYDYVLLDSPALSVGADARLIASSCDATIVLASESNINRRALNKTRDSLTSVGANVIGVVVNGGMAAALPRDEMPSFDAAKPPAVQVTSVRPNPFIAPAREAKPEPVQSVIAAQVHREIDAEPHIAEPPLEIDDRPSVWTYLFLLILLIAGWMAFSGMWGAGTIASGSSASIAATAGLASSTRAEPVAMLMGGVGLLVAILIAGFLVRPPRQEIAVVGASSILAVCSFYGRTINTLWSAQQSGVLASSAAGVTLLFASLLFLWAVARRTERLSPRELVEPDSMADIALAVFAQICAMSALMIVLSHWQSKAECLAVIAFASCLSAMLAVWIAPLRGSLFYWCSPLAVALFGYLCALINQHGLHIGMLVQVARPLPMDYASMGPIGAVLGFWIARNARRLACASPLPAD